jgi:hypothetical protein
MGTKSSRLCKALKYFVAVGSPELMIKDKQNRVDFDMVVTPTPSIATAGKLIRKRRHGIADEKVKTSPLISFSIGEETEQNTHRS